jgi:AAA domain
MTAINQVFDRAAEVAEQEAVAKRAANDTKPKRSIAFLEPGELTKPLPPRVYLLPALGIAEGAPTIITGYGYSRKTLCAQALALSVATGADFMGVYRPTRRGKVVHFDFEQGQRLTIERYQRMARALGVDLDGEVLRVACHPGVRLTDNDAEQVYADAIGDATLVILDSLRAATPGADENSSEVREYIDLVSRVCAPVKAVPLFIHHSKKPKGDDPSGAKYAMRGSSSIFDAAASVFMLSAETGEPTRIEHEKDRNTGQTVEAFYVGSEDVAIDGNPKAGLKLVHMEAAQVMASQPNPHTELMRRIVSHLEGVGGTFLGNKDALRADLQVNRQACLAALSQLESSGLVAVENRKKGYQIQLVKGSEHRSSSSTP